MSMVQRVSKAAKAKGLKIPEVGKTLGIGETSIYRWDDSSPSCQKALDVAELLEMDINYLLTGEHIHPKLPPKHQKLLNRYEKFTSEKQHLVEVMFDAFATDLDQSNKKEITQGEKNSREKEIILSLLENQVAEEVIKNATKISDEEFEVIKQEFLDSTQSLGE